MLVVIIVIVLAIVLYLLLWPTRVTPSTWTAPQPPSLTDGPYRYNDALKALQRIAQIDVPGPEGVAVDTSGRVYAGYADGRVARFAADGSGYQLLGNTGGRPLGMRPMADGSVWLCDADKGLIRITAHGAVEYLVDEAEGLRFGFTNDLDVTTSGDAIYFTDSSHKWGFNHDIDDLIEHGGLGRLMRYDLHTRETKVLLKGLQFANGVAVGPDDAYVLVAETGQYRVQRYWLKGPKAGTAEIFIDDLPGFPDNISFNGSDRFWLAIAAPRNAIIDGLSNKPLLRKIVARMPKFVQPKPVRHAIVLALDTGGNVVANLQYKGDDAYWMITSACEFGDWLYCGSVTDTSIARMPLHDALATRATP